MSNVTCLHQGHTNPDSLLRSSILWMVAFASTKSATSSGCFSIEELAWALAGLYVSTLYHSNASSSSGPISKELAEVTLR